MTKTPISRAAVDVSGDFLLRGSVLAGTIKSSGTGFTVDLAIESDAPREQVLHLIRQAEAGCYVMAALREPAPMRTTVTLNGEAVLV